MSIHINTLDNSYSSLLEIGKITLFTMKYTLFLFSLIDKSDGIINFWKGENGDAFITLSNSLCTNSYMYCKYNDNVKMSDWDNSLSR